MPQEQTGSKKISSIGLVAAFGLITMSSSITDISLTAMNVKLDYYYEVQSYIYQNNTICNSSVLAKQAVGDIVSVDKKTVFVCQHDKINVNLEITKISNHVSNFEFEDEYEEI